MRVLRLLSLAVLLSAATGCHSHFVDASVRNATSEPIHLVEVNYPSASFGTQTLAPGQEYKYRFKVLGSGDLKLIYTDALKKEHQIPGPALKEGDEGQLNISIGANGVSWMMPAQRR